MKDEIIIVRVILIKSTQKFPLNLKMVMIKLSNQLADKNTWVKSHTIYSEILLKAFAVQV